MFWSWQLNTNLICTGTEQIERERVRVEARNSCLLSMCLWFLNYDNCWAQQTNKGCRTQRVLWG